MGEVVVQTLDSVIRSNVPAVVPPAQRQLVDLDARARNVTYYKIGQLAEGWERVYNRHITGAMWNREALSLEPEITALNDVIRSFDEAMISLAPVISDHQSVIRQLVALKKALREKPPTSTMSEEERDRFLEQRQARVREAAARVTRSIATMQEKVKTPGLLERIWRKLWGQVQFMVSPDDEERFKMLAASSVSGFSRTAAGYLKLSQPVIDAYATLDLPVWATRAEMLERYAYMIKIYHPDRNPSGEEMSKRINDARTVLMAHYAPASKAAAAQAA